MVRCDAFASAVAGEALKFSGWALWWIYVLGFLDEIDWALGLGGRGGDWCRGGIENLRFLGAF